MTLQTKTTAKGEKATVATETTESTGTTATRKQGTKRGLARWFDRYFEISARGSNVFRELRGGLATFFAMPTSSSSIR
ncbi:hypothetical protein [Arthrobacter terrae]|uniref:hypothetical protein n=1 Tax=Arthrobacter terrae TaxID=2935737 RepID=UPI0035E3FCA9